MATELASAYVTLIPSLKGAQKKIEEQLGAVDTESAGKKMGKKAGKGFSSGMLGMGAVAGAVATMVSKSFGVISNSMSAAISRVDIMNNFPKVMQNLGYSSEDAASSIKKMSDRLTGLPTSLDSMTSMVQQIAPLTGSLDEATEIGLAFNDMLLASGKGTEDQARAMQQYSQVLARGKPEMEDWKTLQEVMPGQLSQVAQSILGVSANSTDLYNAMKDGTVSIDDFNDAILKLDKEGVEGFASFEQQAKDATAGIGTAFANVKTAVVRSIANIIQAIGADSIASAINKFGKLIGEAGNLAASSITKAKAVIESALSAVSKKLEPARNAFVKFFSSFDGIKGVAEAAMVKLNGFLKVVEMGASPVAYLESAFAKTKHELSNLAGSGIEGAIKAAGGLTKKFDESSTALTGHLKLLKMGVPPTTVLGSAFRALGKAVLETPVAAFKEFSYMLGEHLSHYPAICTALESVKGKFDELKSSVRPVVESIGGAASSVGAFAESVASGIPALSHPIETFKSAIAGMASFAMPLLARIIDGVKGFADAFIGAFSGGGGQFSSIIELGSLLFSLTSPLGVAKLLFSSFGSDLQQLANSVGSSLVPILTTLGGILGGTIAALLPGIQSAITSLFPVVQQIISTVTNLVSSVLPVAVSIIQQLSPFIVQIAGLVSQLVAAVSPLVAQLVTAVLPVVEQIAQAVMNFVQAVMPAVTAVLNVVMAAIQALIPVLATIVTVVVSVVSAIVSAIGTVIAVVINIATVIVSVVSTVISVVSSAAATVIGVFGQIGSFIGSVVSTMVNVVSSGFSTAANMVSSMTNAIGGFVSGCFNTVSSIFNSMASTVTNVVSGMVSTASGLFWSMVSGISSICSGIYDVVADGFNSAIGFITGLASEAWTWGADIVQGIIDGIWSTIGGIADAAAGIAGEIAAFLHFSEPDVGPLSNFHTYMPDMMDGLASGMVDNIGTLKKSLSTVAATMSDGLNVGTEFAFDYAGRFANVDFGKGYGISVEAPARESEKDRANEIYEAVYMGVRNAMPRGMTMDGREFIRWMKKEGVAIG